MKRPAGEGGPWGKWFGKDVGTTFLPSSGEAVWWLTPYITPGRGRTHHARSGCITRALVRIFLGPDMLRASAFWKGELPVERTTPTDSTTVSGKAQRGTVPKNKLSGRIMYPIHHTCQI
jgi:hypothetical protein